MDRKEFKGARMLFSTSAFAGILLACCFQGPGVFGQNVYAGRIIDEISGENLVGHGGGLER